MRVTLDLQTNIRDKDVLLVEDIIDSGHTIAHVLELLSTRQPRSLKVCSLLDKAERREVVVFATEEHDFLAGAIGVHLPQVSPALG